MFNHGRFPSHLKKINILENNLCVCGMEGDINHIFFGCPRYGDRSTLLLNRLKSIGFVFPLNVNAVLNSGIFEAYVMLYDFVKRNHIDI